MILKKLIVYLGILFPFLYSVIEGYLSPNEFRNYSPIKSDFTSVEFFKYFKLNLLFYKNDPLIYLRNCDPDVIFGYFKHGNISNYFDYENYGSIAINLNIVILKKSFTPTFNDSLDFFVEGKLKMSFNLSDSSFSDHKPNEKLICDEDIYSFDISLIYKNDKTTYYSPLLFEIRSRFDPLSEIYWAISNIQLIKVDCPNKCKICNSQVCTGCTGTGILFKPSSFSCYCDTTNDIYDYSDINEKIDCRTKYLLAQEEDFTKPYIDTNWFWNGNAISPFYFKTKCPSTNSTIFGGYKTFGDSDVLTRLVKFNDQSIYTKFNKASSGNDYLNIAAYKIDLTLAYINWDKSITALQILTATKSSILNLLISDKATLNVCNSDDKTTQILQSYSYSGLNDNPKYANVTLVMSPSTSRTNNNFGITNFKFSVSPCFKTCLTCSSPSSDACLSCLDPNSILINGVCDCNQGYTRDILNPTNPCVPIVVKTLVQNGVANMTNLGYGSIMSNNIRSSSKYCNRTRNIVGGYIIGNLTSNLNRSLDIVTSEIGLSFYMKKVTMQLVSEDDSTLLFPFVFKYNQKIIKTFTENQIKYLKFTDPQATTGINCYDGQLPERAKYKHYHVSFFLTDNSLITDLSIIDNRHLFWGVLSLNIQYFGCHPNCNTCTGWGLDQCIICKPGMILNPLNQKNMTSSCICDTQNGYYMTSNVYDPLVCSKSTLSSFTNYYIGALDREVFFPFVWKNTFSIVGDDPKNTKVCGNEVIIGDKCEQGYLEKKMNFTYGMTNFNYFQLDFNFNLFFYNYLPSYTMRVYIDNNYVWGQYYSNLKVGVASDETLICDSGKTMYYRKYMNFTYYDNDYLRNVINKNSPTLRFEVLPDSECKLNSKCGWGINKILINVNKANPSVNATCNYYPFSTCPCADATAQCPCFPGYFSNKLSYGEFECTPCIKNCLTCTSLAKCDACQPGYSLLGSTCVPAIKTLLDTQTNMLQFNVNQYYKNLQYMYQGFSVNLWIKLGNILTTVEKPLVLIDPFLLTYNSTASSFNLKFTNYNYLFSYSSLFPIVMQYPMNPSQKSIYETQWVPIAIAFNSNLNKLFIQMKINGGNSTIWYYETSYLPSMIQLFNYFSSVSYRYLKVWDRYIPTDILNNANYIQKYADVPSDLIAYYSLIEGFFLNQGNSNLVYVMKSNKFKWNYDTSVGPVGCYENQYYDASANICKYCDTRCSSCYDAGAASCVSCKDPFPFLDNENRLCKKLCEKSKVANYQYISVKVCQEMCPPECEICDNLNGCIKCKPNYIRYNNTCISYCTPQIAAVLPSCSKLNLICSQSITITNKQSFFIMDGSNFKLNVNVVDCGDLLSIRWVSSLDPKKLIINNRGKSLYINARDLSLSTTQNFKAYLSYMDNPLELISYDSVDVNFVTTKINGGNVMSFYMNETITFSADYFSQFVVSQLEGVVEYSWTCPLWVNIKYCSPRTNKPVIKVNGNDIIAGLYFRYDSLYEVILDINLDGQLYTKLYGFVIIYSQPSLKNYLSFSVYNTTNVAYNVPVKYKASLINDVDYNALKNDITIKWSINSTNINYLSNDNLPLFAFKATDNTYGTFNLTCEITYRKDTPVEFKLSNSAIVNINPPVTGGIFTVFPTSGKAITTNFRFSVFGYKSNNRNYGKYVFQYYYLNSFNEYQQIVSNKDDLTSSFSPNMLPPTTSIKMRLYYDSVSFVESTQNVTVAVVDKFNYLLEIDKIFSEDVSDSFAILEVYALNFRNDTNTTNTSPVIIKFVDKVLEIIQYSLDNKDYANDIYSSIPKIGNILEAVSYRMKSAIAYRNFVDVFQKTFKIANEWFNEANIFSKESNNNFVRTYDNLLVFIVTNPEIINYINELDLIVSFSFLNVDIGLQKIGIMVNLEMRSILLNYMMRKDYVEKFPSNPSGTSQISIISNSDIYSLSSNNNTNNKICNSVTVPVSTITSVKDDIILLVQRYPKSEILKPTLDLLKKSKEKVALTSEQIGVTLLSVRTVKQVNSKLRSLQSQSNNQTNSTQGQNSSKTNITQDIMEYKEINIVTDGRTAIINFTLPIIYPSEILTKTTCLKLEEFQGIAYEKEDGQCNTWFDYETNIVQCECDVPGYYVIAYDPQFKNIRKGKQFPQLTDDINKGWGFGTLIVLLAIFFGAVITAYLKDKKELTELNDPAAKKGISQGFRNRVKTQLLGVTEMTFGMLFCEILKQTNDFASLKHYKDFYFLRVHRVLIVLLRVFMTIFFCFWKQRTIMDPDIEAQVLNRDIRIKNNRYDVYNWRGDWVDEITKSIYFAIPIGLFMILFPRLTEWIFLYDENELRYLDNTYVVQELTKRYFKSQIRKTSSLDVKDNNAIGRGMNIEMSVLNKDYSKLSLKQAENEQLQGQSNLSIIGAPGFAGGILENNISNLELKKFRAFTNINRLVSSLIFDLRYQLYISEKQDTLPEDLAPIYVQKLRGQIEVYENRMYTIREQLHKDFENLDDDDSEHKARTPELFKDKKKILFNMESHLLGKDGNLKEMMNLYGYSDKLNFGVKSRPVFESEAKELLEIGEVTDYKEYKRKQIELDKEKEEMKKKEKEAKNKSRYEENQKKQLELKKIQPKNPANAFIPYLIEKNIYFKRNLLIKITIIVGMITVLVYFITILLIAVRNEGGNEKAFFWVILGVLSFVYYYFIFLPVTCLIKTIILTIYGAFYPKKFSCNFRNLLIYFFITRTDRAVFKELAQCIKNNSNSQNDNQNLLTQEKSIYLTTNESVRILTSKENSEFDAKQKPENVEKLENVKIKKNNDKNSKISSKKSQYKKLTIPEYVDHHEFEHDKSFSVNEKININEERKY